MARSESGGQEQGRPYFDLAGVISKALVRELIYCIDKSLITLKFPLVGLHIFLPVRLQVFHKKIL